MGIKRKKAVISSECVACGCCVGSCPLGAIRVFKGMYALVDEKKCVGCGRCAGACPAAVIRIEGREAAS
jgi:ferredoxin